MTRFRSWVTAIALLGIYPRDTGVLMHRGTRTPMFIAVLSTITKLRKEPKRPSTDEWIKKMWFIYTVEYYLAMRKNEILSFATTWVALEGIMLTEISQPEKDRYHVFTHMWILRNITADHGKVEGEGKKKVEEGTCWDEHWVLYGNQFDNKLHILTKKEFPMETSKEL